MLNLSLDESKLIAKNCIKGYKNMSEVGLLSAFNASELVKESKAMPDTIKINKTTKEIIKQIVIKTKYLKT